MKRITLVLGIVAVMVTMIVAPAMAKDNNGHKGGGDKANTAKNDGNHNNENRNNGIDRLDNRLERIDNRVENQLDRLEDSFDESVEVDFVGDVDSDDVAYYWYYPYYWYYCNLGLACDCLSSPSCTETSS